MKKNVFGRQLKRDTNERKALFKNLMTALILRDRIQTTEPKAKAIRASIEKLVTKAKKQGINATSGLLPFLHKDAVKKLLEDIAPRFSERPGGYTRIIKLGRRFGDDASTVVMEWVEGTTKFKTENVKIDNKQTTNFKKIESAAKISKSKEKKVTKKSQPAKKVQKKVSSSTLKKGKKK